MKFVVTGIGRSGTKYTSTLLTNAGIPCTWETAFKVNKQDLKLLNESGDSSWLAAPFISKLPKGTIVLHQTRNPLNWLNSWLKVSAHWGFAHTNFVDDNCGFFRWKDGEHPQVDMKLYVKWNEMIEKAAAEANLTYLRYKVEDLDFKKVMEIATLTRSKIDQVNAFDIVKTTNKNINASKYLKYTPIIWDTLPQCQELDDFKAMTLKYGYTIE